MIDHYRAIVGAMLLAFGIAVVPPAIAASESPPNPTAAPGQASTASGAATGTAPDANKVVVPDSNKVVVPSAGAAPDAKATTAPDAATNPTKALEVRASKYWQARALRDLKTMYEMESAALPGGWLTLEKASLLGGMPVRKTKVEQVTVKDDRGEIEVSAEVMVGTLGWTQQTQTDKWVLINGQWYHETIKPGFNLPTTQ